MVKISDDIPTDLRFEGNLVEGEEVRVGGGWVVTEPHNCRFKWSVVTGAGLTFTPLHFLASLFDTDHFLAVVGTVVPIVGATSRSIICLKEAYGCFLQVDVAYKDTMTAVLRTGNFLSS